MMKSSIGQAEAGKVTGNRAHGGFDGDFLPRIAGDNTCCRLSPGKVVARSAASKLSLADMGALQFLARRMEISSQNPSTVGRNRLQKKADEP